MALHKTEVAALLKNYSLVQSQWYVYAFTHMFIHSQSEKKWA